MKLVTLRVAEGLRVAAGAYRDFPVNLRFKVSLPEAALHLGNVQVV